MNKEEVISSLSKEELISNVDNFFGYMNIEIIPNESLLGKIKKLEKVKSDLLDGKYIMEYFLGYENDAQKIAELNNKIEANNSLAFEISLYIKYLSKYVIKNETGLIRRLINKIYFK